MWLGNLSMEQWPVLLTVECNLYFRPGFSQASFQTLQTTDSFKLTCFQNHLQSVSIFFRIVNSRFLLQFLCYLHLLLTFWVLAVPIVRILKHLATHLLYACAQPWTAASASFSTPRRALLYCASQSLRGVQRVSSGLKTDSVLLGRNRARSSLLRNAVQRSLSDRSSLQVAEVC